MALATLPVERNNSCDSQGALKEHLFRVGRHRDACRLLSSKKFSTFGMFACEQKGYGPQYVNHERERVTIHTFVGSHVLVSFSGNGEPRAASTAARYAASFRSIC